MLTDEPDIYIFTWNMRRKNTIQITFLLLLNTLLWPNGIYTY